MSELRTLLAEPFRPYEGETVALLFSGGVDSATVGFAAEDAGCDVHAYTFALEGTPSKDALAAETFARRLGWPLTRIDVPTDLETVRSDFLVLAERYGCRKKTQFECTWPFLYLYPEIEETVVGSGVAADGHYGLSKKAMIHFRTPKSAFDGFRTDYFSSPNPAGVRQQEQLAGEYGKTFLAPYLERAVFDYFSRMSWSAINRPFQKYAVVREYPEKFGRGGGIERRKHANLQLVAGIPDVFERLLETDLNAKSRTRVLDLCRDHAL